MFVCVHSANNVGYNLCVGAYILTRPFCESKCCDKSVCFPIHSYLAGITFVICVGRSYNIHNLDNQSIGCLLSILENWKRSENQICVVNAMENPMWCYGKKQMWQRMRYGRPNAIKAYKR